ncbi:50S ribosomal protein L6 [bioreactor metagenome]|uniref:50S ribosomal protein L6 n=1 Tax=bioreactor metagenome TaxID=1076179 RepID=A0A645CHI0_9ZZZZ
MSRIGNKTITIPAGVEVEIKAGNEVTVKGPKGSLTRQFTPELDIENNAGTITVSRPNDEKHTKQLHGTTRALIHNMIVGVSEGFAKTLEIVGIGYKAAIEGNKLTLTIGYSHPVVIMAEDGIKIECKTPTEVIVSGVDKQRVGEIASNIRAVRRPEPYLGKGIRYKNEHIRRKEGKTAAKS